MKIQEAQGHLFELAFNVGLLTAINQSEMKYDHMGLFIDDLKRINHRTLVDKFAEMKQTEGYTDAESLRIWKAWAKFLLLRGHLSGLSLWNELMDAFGCSRKQSRNWQLLYMQCCLSDEASMSTLAKQESERYGQILSQFNISQDRVLPLINQYADTGEFLKADTLMLMSKKIGNKQEYRLVCVDLSAFTVKSEESSESNDRDNESSPEEGKPVDSWNLSIAESILKHLKRELNYLKSKSVYHQLKLDTQNRHEQKLIIGKNLKHYLTAFSYYDKEFVKLVQAASYSASFIKFLESNVLPDEHKIPQDASLQVTALGYTTRGINTLNVGREDFDILDRCAEAYKFMKQKEKSSRQHSSDPYERSLDEMLKLIKKTATYSLSRSPSRSDRQQQQPEIQQFVSSLCDVTGAAEKVVSLTETIERFYNPSDYLDDAIASKYQLPQQVTLRDAHTKIIQAQLLGDCRYLFLTGNPGIGKTTAVVNFLRDRADEGFLFFYVSPRLSVNEDTINKFRDESRGLFDDDLYCIYTNRVIIESNNKQPTVRYYSNRVSRDFTLGSVNFFCHDDDPNRITKRHSKISALSRSSLTYDKQSGTGVIRSLCDAGHALINHKKVNKIAIACSTQSLRKVSNVRDSLDNFGRLFRSATNNDGPIPERMQELSHRMKHIIVTIDEVTGDSAGVEWFHSMKKWLGLKLELFDPSHDFNTKLIIADASLTGVDLVKPHLGNKEAEPDKIYCTSVEQDPEPLEISYESFDRKSNGSSRGDSTIINVNSYPASVLELNYKVFFEVNKLNEDGSIKQKSLGQSNRDRSLVSEIIQHVQYSESGQLLVYIQNKSRLTGLIDLVKQQLPGFDKNEEYIEIHSQVFDANKLEDKDKVKVVFMTSSAARGISFPLAKHIIVELPRFQIENNLMEIIQVIYRGRGQFNGESNYDRERKQVTAYIVEELLSNVTNPLDPSKKKLSQIVRTANLIGSILVLRTAIMTRIAGAGYLGDRQVAMIPIGGKAMYSGGETFSTRIKFIQQQLQTYLRLNQGDRHVKLVLENLPRFLESAKFLVNSPRNSSNSPIPQKQQRKKISLLSLLESGVEVLFQSCSSMADLLNIEISPQVYMDGSLFIFPLNDAKVNVSYSVDPYTQTRKYVTPEFRNSLKRISEGDYPPNIQHEIDLALEFIEHLDFNENSSQTLSDSSQFSDQYCAVPLHFLVADDTLRDSFTENKPSPVSQDYRQVLERYVKALYPANDFLPIGNGFVKFPFVIFKSYDLAQIRRSLFKSNYFLNSRSLNLLNLMLLRE